MSDLKVQRRSALPPVASQRPDDTYRADAQLARKLMLSEYASLLSRAAPLARDVQPVPIALNDAPFARARSVGQHPPIPQQEEKLRASQQAFRRAATLPASVPLPVPPQATKLARQASEKSAPKRATPPAPAPTQATSSVEGRYDGGTRVQSPSHITDADRGLFTFLGSKTIFRSDVFAAVKANFGRVEVAGDGNCGFYSLLAGLVVHAMDFSQSRSTIAARLRELGQDDGNVDRAYKRMTGELSYATPKEPGAMHRGRQALRELANELALRPEGALTYVQAHGNAFEKACFVLRATAIAGYSPARQIAKLDHHALLNDDLAPLSSSFGISLVVPSVDPSATAWTSKRLRDLSQTRYRQGEIHLLHSQNHFDLLLPRHVEG